LKHLVSSFAPIKNLSLFSILAAITVNELLLLAKGSMMRFVSAVHDLKAFTKFIMQALWTIAYHFQPTATVRSISRKSCDNHMPTLADCLSYRIYVALAVSGLRQEVENSPIMPDVIGLLG
jgi:hypothetical protein